MPHRSIVSICFLSLLSAGLACEPSETPDADQPDAWVASEPVEPRPRAVEASAAEHVGDPADAAKRRRVAPDAKRAFDEMVGLIDEHYVDGPLSEDELWTAAMEGVMQRLIQLEDHEINALLSPEELADLMSGTKGSIVGVGIMIEQVAQVTIVKGTIPGGPAETAGLRGGDRILAVDGHRLNGVSLADGVDLIRGAEGTKVELFVQREAEEWSVAIERGVVKVPSVEGKMLTDAIAYLRINSFSETTVVELDQRLTQLDAAGMKSLVIDLRDNPGGLLEPALEAADRFLAPGLRIVTIRGREGEQHEDAVENDPWDTLPLVVLTGPNTASGAEILAAALDEHERASIVGERTMGKGTVEAIHDLPNAWALKLSMSRFFSPDGEPRQRNGVEPDFRIATPGSGLETTLDAISPASDPALEAALELLGR